MAIELIERQTLTSAAGTISFSSLGSYKDLLIIGNYKQTTGVNSLRVRVGNGSVDTGSNYDIVSTYVDNTTLATGGENNTSWYLYGTGDGTSTLMSACVFTIFDYRSTDKYKVAQGMSGRGLTQVSIETLMWKSKSAITVISLAMGATFPVQNFDTGTSFSVYGIK